MTPFRILFVCHGNICRSTMAEYLFRDLAARRGYGDRFSVESRATSTEELGNPVHPGTRRVLDRLGIDCRGKTARQITRTECDEADLIVIMDEKNRRGLLPFLGENGGKVRKLLAYAGEDRDVADPWYTGDFEATFRDVDKGCRALLRTLTEKRT